MENKYYLCIVEFQRKYFPMDNDKKKNGDMAPMNIIKKYRLAVIGMAVGAVGGFLYWKFVGCSSGTCPITSSPLMSTLWGALMGGLLFDMFNKKDDKQHE